MIRKGGARFSCSTKERVIAKSGTRFSEKIMLHQKSQRQSFNLKRLRSKNTLKRSGTLTTSRGKAEKQTARAARLSAALRENLKRRKAQARGRAQSVKPDPLSSPADAADERPTPDFRRNRSRD
jgi:hypothetical protein